MKIKMLIIGIITAGIVFFSVGSAKAQTASPTESVRTVFSRPLKAFTGSASAGLKGNASADNLKNRGIAEIQRRITALTELLTKINSLKHVSSSTKSTMSSKIQNEITNLNTLQTKIQGETDVAIIKTDVRSVITSHRIFALFMPQVRLLTGADALLNSSDSMSSLSAKLQTRITTAQTSGKDVTSLNSLLSDMQGKIADAIVQANAIISDVTPLTPEGYPGNKTILQGARTKLQTGTQDLKTAGQNARQIIQGLLVFRENSGTTQSTTSGNLNTPNSFPGSY